MCSNWLTQTIILLVSFPDMLFPSMQILPWSGTIYCINRFKIVDFPTPLGPMIAYFFPFWKVWVKWEKQKSPSCTDTS